MALTLSASRNRVITKMTAGNAAKSSGRWTNIAVSRMSSPAVMLSAINRSSTIAGSGTTSMTTISTMPTGTPSWVRRFGSMGCLSKGHLLARPPWQRGDAVLASPV